MENEKIIHRGQDRVQFYTKKSARISVYPLCRQGSESKGRGRVALAEGEIAMTVYGREDPLAKRAILSVFAILPVEIRREIEAKVHSQGKSPWEIEEIRLSRIATSSVCFSAREYSLCVRVGGESIASIVKAICHGAPFAHREEMAEGYLPFDEGVRVGVVGICRYVSGEELPSIREIHTLVFRIPHQPSREGEIEKLSIAVRGKSRRGCLIVSPPRVGKTTVLRMLCRALSTGTDALRVAVVDTRCEFTEEDSRGAFLDVLPGYPRRLGGRIALRTLAPEVVGMDEIGGEGDVDALCDVMRAGVLILATAHACGVEDLFSRPYLSPILRAGVFDTVLSLHRKQGVLQWKLFQL